MSFDGTLPGSTTQIGLTSEDKIGALDAMMHTAFDLEAVLLLRHPLNYRTLFLYSQPEPVEPPC